MEKSDALIITAAISASRSKEILAKGPLAKKRLIDQPHFMTIRSRDAETTMSDPPIDDLRQFVIDELQTLMRQRDLRWTRESTLVVDALLKLASPFAAEKVFKMVSQLNDEHRVMRSTVYRSLILLEELGLLRCETSPHSSALYYHTISPDPPSVCETMNSPASCESAHRKMVAGTCPWCGRAIVQGVVQK